MTDKEGRLHRTSFNVLSVSSVCPSLLFKRIERSSYLHLAYTAGIASFSKPGLAAHRALLSAGRYLRPESKGYNETTLDMDASFCIACR